MRPTQQDSSIKSRIVEGMGLEPMHHFLHDVQFSKLLHYHSANPL